jgi:uncharacterized protein
MIVRTLLLSLMLLNLLSCKQDVEVKENYQERDENLQKKPKVIKIPTH